jgi:hypothetical protein
MSFIMSEQKQKAFYQERWENVSPADRVPHEKKARGHLAKQSVMKETVVNALQKDKGGNCSRSYASVAKDTGDWCSSQTIFNWLKSQPDFCLYTKRIRPGLTEANRHKQIEFSKHVYNRWGVQGNHKISGQ